MESGLLPGNHTLDVVFVVRIVICSALSILMLVAFLGNAILIFVVIFNSGMHSRSNMFLTHLSLCHLASALVLMPVGLITAWVDEWVFGTFFCTVIMSFTLFLLCATGHTILYLSLHKLFHSKGSRRRVWLLLALVWAFALVGGAGPVTGWVPVVTGNVCTVRVVHTSRTTVFHALYIFIGSYSAPSGIIVIVFIRIYVFIRIQRRNGLSQESLGEYIAGVNCVLYVFLLFVVCATPYSVYSLLLTFLHDRHKTDLLDATVYWFGYFQAAGFPLVVIWKNTAFRRGFAQLLCACQTNDFDVEISDKSPSLRQRIISFQNRPSESDDSDDSLRNELSIRDSTDSGVVTNSGRFSRSNDRPKRTAVIDPKNFRLRDFEKMPLTDARIYHQNSIASNTASPSEDDWQFSNNIRPPYSHFRQEALLGNTDCDYTYICARNFLNPIKMAPNAAVERLQFLLDNSNQHQPLCDKVVQRGSSNVLPYCNSHRKPVLANDWNSVAVYSGNHVSEDNRETSV